MAQAAGEFVEIEDDVEIIETEDGVEVIETEIFENAAGDVVEVVEIDEVITTRRRSHRSSTGTPVDLAVDGGSARQDPATSRRRELVVAAGLVLGCADRWTMRREPGSCERGSHGITSAGGGPAGRLGWPAHGLDRSAVRTAMSSRRRCAGRADSRRTRPRPGGAGRDGLQSSRSIGDALDARPEPPCSAMSSDSPCRFAGR